MELTNLNDNIYNMFDDNFDMDTLYFRYPMNLFSVLNNVSNNISNMDDESNSITTKEYSLYELFNFEIGNVDIDSNIEFGKYALLLNSNYKHENSFSIKQCQFSGYKILINSYNHKRIEFVDYPFNTTVHNIVLSFKDKQYEKHNIFYIYQLLLKNLYLFENAYDSIYEENILVSRLSIDQMKRITIHLPSKQIQDYESDKYYIL